MAKINDGPCLNDLYVLGSEEALQANNQCYGDCRVPSRAQFICLVYLAALAMSIMVALVATSLAQEVEGEVGAERGQHTPLQVEPSPLHPVPAKFRVRVLDERNKEEQQSGALSKRERELELSS